jgi:hypothetical protein
VNDDFLDILRALLDARARFLVVGAHAMAVHGVPRATGDLDVWVDPQAGNADRVWSAILRFGAPVQSLGVSRDDLLVPGTVIQMGMPPRRVDSLTQLSGLDFDQAWGGRVLRIVGGVEIPFLGKAALITNKKATHRSKDLADLEELEKE